MKKAWIALLSLLCLAGCRLHDDYTGEPYIRIEYTLNGEHQIYEDWGHEEVGLLSNFFVPYTTGRGLSLLNLAENESVAFFELHTRTIFLYLESNKPYFIDGKQYVYYQREGTSGCCVASYPYTALSEGWFSITRHTTEPYCRFDLSFELHGMDGNQPVDITEGIIQVGRRFQKGSISGLIKKEGEL